MGPQRPTELAAVAVTFTTTADLPVAVVIVSGRPVRSVGRRSWESRKAAPAHCWASSRDAVARSSLVLCLTTEVASEVNRPHAFSPTEALPLAATTTCPFLVPNPTIVSSELTVQSGGTS